VDQTGCDALNSPKMWSTLARLPALSALDGASRTAFAEPFAAIVVVPTVSSCAPAGRRTDR
jgi:hypothetical protein